MEGLENGGVEKGGTRLVNTLGRTALLFVTKFQTLTRENSSPRVNLSFAEIYLA